MLKRIVLISVVACSWFAAQSCSHPTDVGGSQGIHERWYRTQDGVTQSRPSVVGGVVYYGSGTGHVIARDVQTGDIRWEQPVFTDAIMGRRIVTAAGVSAAAVVITSTWRQVAALDAVTGRVLWRYVPPVDSGAPTGGGPPAAGAMPATSMDADDATVFVPAWGASVSAVDLRTGTVKWVWQADRATSDTARTAFRSGAEGVVVSGTVVYATAWHWRDALGTAAEAWLIALDRTNGRELWRAVMPSYTSGRVVQGAPAVAGDVVVFTSVGGRVYGIDRATGRLDWQFLPSTQFATSAEAELADGVVYADGGNQHVYALRASDGSVLWDRALGWGAQRDLLVTSRRVYYPAFEAMYVLDRATGATVARAAVRGYPDVILETPAAAAGGRVFLTLTRGAWSFDDP